ncbi:MAG: hypothetical protein KGJ29_15235, partial [Hyphomicrobiales bacterium]|nr:hypothetical protein [Hyphomicrobiales bacterium]
DVDRLARERAEKQAIVTRDAERLQEMAVQRVQRDAGNPTRDAAIIKQTENDRRVMRDTDKLVEETRQPSRAERAEAEIDRISSDTSLSFQEKLDALRKIDHPNDTFDPEKHRSKPAVSPEQQIVENVREYERQHPELNQKHTKKHKMK